MFIKYRSNSLSLNLYTTTAATLFQKNMYQSHRRSSLSLPNKITEKIKKENKLLEIYELKAFENLEQKEFKRVNLFFEVNSIDVADFSNIDFDDILTI